MKIFSKSIMFIATVSILCSYCGISFAEYSFETEKNSEDYATKLVGSDRYDTNRKTLNYFEDLSNVSYGDPDDIENLVNSLNKSISNGIPFVFTRNKKYVDKVNIEENRKNIDIPTDNEENNSKSVIVVNHMSDLISSLGYATKNKSRIIYSDGTNLPDLSGRDVLLIGGHVKNIGGFNQIIGKDRFDTNEILNSKSNFKGYILVNGYSFYDSISAINMAIASGDGILLANKNASNVNLNNYKLDYIVGGAVKIERDIVYVNPHQDDEILTMGLPLLRDITNNKKNTYLMLMTDGGKTASISAINRRLRLWGYDEINISDIIESRNSEMHDCLMTLGMQEENIIYHPYPNLDISSGQVENVLENFYSTHKNMEIKTMSVNNYDTSHGNIDHLACKEGSINVAKKYNLKYTLLSAEGGDKTLIPTDGEKEILMRAASKYEVFDPEDKRYSVGYISVGYLFDKFKDGVFNYGINFR